VNPSKVKWALPLSLVDLLLLTGMFMLGYWVRHFLLAPVMGSDFRLSGFHYLASGMVLGIVQITLMSIFGAYRREFGLGKVEEVAAVLRAAFMGTVITFAITFLTRQLFFSRFVLLFALPFGAVCVSSWHTLYRRISRNLARRRGRPTRVVMYGTGPLARELSDYMTSRAQLLYSVEGYVSPVSSPGEMVIAPTIDPGEWADWMERNGIRDLVVADQSLSRDEQAAVLLQCEQRGFSYRMAADLYTMVSLTSRLVNMAGNTMVESVPPPLDTTGRILKRTCDILGSGFVMLLLSPFFPLFAALIAVESPGGIFYLQTRLGKNNKPFRIVKFRSMRTGAHGERHNLKDRNESTGPLFKMKADPRVTHVGRFMRRWSLDELPQLYNVLVGEMSLVGPRPPLPEEVNEYSRRDFKRLRTVPGITGVWQVSGRSELGFEEMVKLDLFYVDNWSIWLDLAILLLTVPAIFTGEGAY
jgi:exopolysaccharide biosynthesis polyprenyl glycosylphosphotransferase